MIQPPPTPPYWPAYPEPEWSRLEAVYLHDHEKWERCVRFDAIIMFAWAAIIMATGAAVAWAILQIPPMIIG